MEHFFHISVFNSLMSGVRASGSKLRMWEIVSYPVVPG